MQTVIKYFTHRFISESLLLYVIRKNKNLEALQIYFKYNSVQLILYVLVNQQTNDYAKENRIENISQSVRETENKPFGFQVKQPPIIRMIIINYKKMSIYVLLQANLSHPY